MSHATPASLYAHSANREWECDRVMHDHANATKDITWQLVNTDPGKKAKVVLGGGRASFLPETGDWKYDFFSLKRSNNF